jgi:hypothetical protein
MCALLKKSGVRGAGTGAFSLSLSLSPLGGSALNHEAEAECDCDHREGFVIAGTRDAFASPRLRPSRGGY